MNGPDDKKMTSFLDGENLAPEVVLERARDMLVALELRDRTIQHLRKQVRQEESRPGFRLYHDAGPCELTEADVAEGAEYEGAEVGEYPLAKIVDSFEALTGVGVCHVFECPKCLATFVVEFGTR